VVVWQVMVVAKIVAPLQHNRFLMVVMADLIHIILVEGLVLRKRAGLVAAGAAELVDLVVAVDMLAVAPMYLV
jgi:hypothetical protein